MVLSPRHINREWVTGLCRDLTTPTRHSAAHSTNDVELTRFDLMSLPDNQGVISRYERSTEQSIVGHRVLRMHWTAAGEAHEKYVVIKSKVPGSTIRQRLEAVYRKQDPHLADLQLQLAPSLLDDCHTRELEIYRLKRPSLQAITPAVLRVWLDRDEEIFAVVMELFESMRHEKTLSDLDVWLPRDIDCALSHIAQVHGDFLGQLSPTAPPAWLLPFHQMNNQRLLDYEAALLRYNADAFPELFPPERVRMLESFLASAPARHRAIMDRPLTLVHGDFNPRNICLRVDDPGQMRLCAYDWELALVHLPQRDVCEFLCYVLNPNRGWNDESTVQSLERYRMHLKEASGQSIDIADFQEDMSMALKEFCTFKLLVQGITHQLLGNRYYFERMVQNAFDGIAAYAGRAN